MEQHNKLLHEKYEFRNIKRDEIEQAVKIEAVCFPPNETCTYEHMAPRIQKYRNTYISIRQGMATTSCFSEYGFGYMLWVWR